MSDYECGGCEGLGAHSPRCTTRPGWRFRRWADEVGTLADEIGANDPVASNGLYAVRAVLLERATSDA